MLKSYRELRVWQEGMSLAEACYTATRSFPRSEIFGLTSQIRRAAVSIPANIAEGYGRRTTGDYLRFLYIAQGSLKELETHFLLAQRLNMVPSPTVEPILALSDDLGRMLGGLCRSLETRALQPSSPSSGRRSRDTRHPTPDTRVRTLQPVIFIPADQVSAYREAFGEALWRAVGDAMRWWRRQRDRDVFQALPVVEFVGKKSAEAYFSDTQAKAEQELRGVWPVGRDGVTYLCYGLWGEGPYQTPGNVIGTSGDYLVVQSSTSLVIFTDGAFPGYAPSEPWNSRAAQTGALAHELGHTLGLPHTEDVERGRGADSIMQEWWRYPHTSLTPRENAAVRAAIGAPRRA